MSLKGRSATSAFSAFQQAVLAAERHYTKRCRYVCNPHRGFQMIKGVPLYALAALLVTTAMVSRAGQSTEPKVALLWPSGAPGAVGEKDADRPTLTIYSPSAKGAATGVVVCPGGGYGALAMDHEGRQVAEWLNSLGLAAFVLKYRTAPRYHHPVPFQDAQRGLRFVRAHANDFGVEPRRIGIWGFSAGGHLASTVGTHFDAGDPQASDPVDRMSSRPDFLILAYPVISFTTPYTHQGSLKNLLGLNPDPKLVEGLSNEKHVTAETPPTFLFHTSSDSSVPPENSVLFYLALRKAGVPAEMHLYERGRHGVGLAPSDSVLSSWPKRLEDWLRVRGLLANPQ